MSQSDPGAATRLTALYEAHAADAFRYALHLTGRREDAEDVVQFVFLRAYGMLESGTALVNPRAWLIKATKHRSLNLIRDRRETRAIDADIPVAPRHDEDAAEADALAEVRATLWALPESQHHAFVLRHWSGLSQDEIADVLGTTAGAVESLLVRARTALLEDREHPTECTSVRRRLVQALVPTPGHRAHIASCRRCRTAQTRLLRASEFATAFALVPRPHVAHGLASLIPGFGGHVAAATAGGGAAGAGATGGAGTGVATATASAKLAVASKIALVTATAVVALGAAHPVRRAVEHAVLGTSGGSVAAAAPATARSHTGAAAAQGTTATGPAPRSAHTPPPAPAKGAKAKGKAAHAGGNGKAKGKGKTKGKTNGAPAAPGGNGKSATAGSNGKATGKPATAGKPAKTGTAKGKSATAGSNGKAKGKGAAAAGSADNGAAKGHGKS